MTASLCIIGSELTRGVISDSHARFLSEKLALSGYEVNEIRIIPDDGSISRFITDEASECDLLIITGGLGPTFDDMTRRAVAQFAGRKLVENRSAAAYLEKKLGSRFVGANRTQTFIPEGFSVIENPWGTACGFHGVVDNCHIVALPGPPRELEPMFLHSVLPMLSKSRVELSEYSVYLIPEAIIEDVCETIPVKGVKWGTRFQPFKISVYLQGDDRERFAAELGNRFGERVRKGDVEAVSLLSSELKKRGMSVCCAESLTGGLLGKLITDEAGSSSYYWGSMNCYAEDAKIKVLGVDERILKEHGAVSSECAAAMAEGILNLSGCDMAISTTGFAGPGGDDVGSVYLGFASRQQATQTVHLKLNEISRDMVRRRSTVAAFLLSAYYLNGGCLLDIVKGWQYYKYE